MALFGYPTRRRTTPSGRARRARIVSALETLNLKNEGLGLPKLSARVGLDSGPVVIDATGEVFGETPSIASRVQGVAEPGTVLITAAVHRHLAGLFVAEDMGAHDLKGGPVPVMLYRVVRGAAAGGGGARAASRPSSGARRTSRSSYAAGSGQGQARVSLSRLSASRASASRGSPTNSASASGRRRTPGSNGRRRNCCRTRRCIR